MKRLCLAFLFFLTAGFVSLAAQALPGAEIPTNATDLLVQLSTTSGIIGVAMALTWAAKKLLVDVSFFKAVPIAVYVIAFSIGLTIFANKVVLSLPGSLPVLILQAIFNAAMASGIREWYYNKAKPLSESGTTPPRAFFVAALIGAGALTMTGCAGKRVDLPTPPQVIVQAANDPLAIGMKALEMIGAATELHGAVIDAELKIVPNLPEPVRSRFHEPFKAASIAFSRETIRATEALEAAVTAGVLTWERLRDIVNPIIAGAQKIVDLSRLMPTTASGKSGFRLLVETLGQLVGSVALPTLREPIPEGVQ